MTKCALCQREATEDLLCESCDQKRLTAASLDRIWTGRGLNYGNAEKFSQRNYIKAVLEDEDA